MRAGLGELLAEDSHDAGALDVAHADGTYALQVHHRVQHATHPPCGMWDLQQLHAAFDGARATWTLRIAPMQHDTSLARNG